MCLVILKYIIQTLSKSNHWISKNRIIICLKDISEKCFSFNVMAIPAVHSGSWTHKGNLDTQRTIRHFSTWRALEENSGTWSLKALGHWGNWAFRHSRHLFCRLKYKYQLKRSCKLLELFWKSKFCHLCIHYCGPDQWNSILLSQNTNLEQSTALKFFRKSTLIQI